VFLEPGEYIVEFWYQPPVGPLYVSLVAVAVALALLGWVSRASREGLSGMSPRMGAAEASAERRKQR